MHRSRQLVNKTSNRGLCVGENWVIRVVDLIDLFLVNVDMNQRLVLEEVGPKVERCVLRE